MAELIEIGVLAALAAWIFTQFHLILAVGRIKRDIDLKRKATETFVDTRLAKLEANVGGFEARMTAQMPPNVHGEVEALQGRFDGLVADLKVRFDNLPGAMRHELLAAQGRETQEMMAAAKQASEQMRTELSAIEAQIPPEALAAQGDFRAKILKAITREPTSKELKGMGLIGETIWNAGRAWIAERMIGGTGISPGGESASYTVTRKSPYGL